MVAVPSDKDGVFVLAHKVVIEYLVKQKLKGSRLAYVQVGIERTIDEYRLAKNSVINMSYTLDKLGHKSWAREALHAFEASCPKGMLSKINITVKTHKPIIECRVIDSARGSYFEGFSGILHHWLSEACASFDFLCKDTRDFLEKLGNTVG